MMNTDTFSSENPNNNGHDGDFYKTLLAHLPHKVFVKDLNSVYLSCNQNYADDLGIQPAEIVGKTDYDFFPPELADKYRQDDHRIMTSGTTEDIEESYRANGQEIFVRTVKTPVTNEAGEIRGIMGIFRDITSQQRMKTSLKNAREFSSKLIESANMIIVGLDLKGEIIIFNQAAAEITGYSKEDLEGQNWFQVIVPKDQFPQVWDEFQRLISGGGSQTFENPILTKSGEERIISWRNNEILEDGAVVGTFSFGIDITEQKEMETQLAITNQAIENSLNAFEIVNEAGEFIYVNKAYVELWGYESAADILGASALAHGACPDDIYKIRELLRKDGHCTLELKAKRRDGSIFDILLYARLGQDHLGREIYFASSIDITDRKQAEEAAYQAQQQLQDMFDNTPAAVYVKDLEGRYIMVNRQWCERTGRCGEEVLGKTTDELFPHLRLGVWEAKEQHVLDTGDPFYSEEVGGTSGRTYLATKYLLYDAEGQPYALANSSIDITERKKAEEELQNHRDHLEELVAARTAELQKSEARFRGLIESMDDVVYTLDRDHRHSGVHGRWIEDAGLTKDYFLGKTVREIIGPERAEIHEAANQKALAGEREIYEWYTDTDEGVKHFQTSLSPIFDNNEEVSSILGVGRNITAQKELEIALRESEARLMEAQTIAQVGNWEWDIQAGTLTWSDEIYRILGQEPQAFEATYAAFLEIVHPEDRAFVETAVGNAIAEIQPYDIEHRIIRPNGAIRFVQEIGKVYFDDLGQPIRMVGTVHDITDSKVIEATIRASEARFRAVFENSPLGILIVGSRAEILEANTAVCTMLGYTTEELQDKSMIEITSPDDYQRTTDVIQLMVLEGEKTYSHEVRLMNKKGQPVWCNLSSTMLLDEQGIPTVGISVIEDISARKKATEELNQLAVKLAQSNEELEQFAYIASHDLQEPLRKITAFGGRLESKYATSLDQRGQDYLARMQAAAERGTRMIHDLLDLSRVTTQGKPFQKTDLAEVLQDVISDLVIQIEKSQGSVAMGDLPVIEADATQMHQLFQNLISNALKFQSPGNQPAVEINSTNHDPDHVQIMVRDNGIGFKSEFSDRIFLPFQRLHGRSEYEGSGIGLSVCHKIVTRHQGSIQAESVSGEGTTFYISLPKKQLKTEKA